MAKIILNDVQNLTAEATAINTINVNSAAIEAAIENTLSRDGMTPNTMNVDLDMNSNRIINLAAPTSATEPLRFGDLDNIGGAVLSTAMQASQAEAIAGTNNTHWMTPLRVSQELNGRLAANVKSYGAVGDGVANDTVAIQNAINDSTVGAIYFPKGTYLCDAEIGGASNKALFGDHAGSTTIKLRSAPINGTDWFFWNACTNVELRGLTFDANNLLTNFLNGRFPRERPMMYFLGGNNFVIRDCRFLNWDTTGILTNTSYDFKFINNIFDRGSQSAGHLTGTVTSGITGAITSGATTFTDVNANFQPGDVGKLIQINGAGIAGGVLTATISVRTSTTNITINRTAPSTVSGASYTYGGAGSQVSITAIEVSGTGVVDGNEARNFLIHGNRIINGSIGVSGHDAVISENIINGHSFGAGIHTQALASNFNIAIVGNVVHDGFLSQDTASAYPGGIENWATGIVANNVCYQCAGPGISVGGRTNVIGNVCYNNGRLNSVLTSMAGFAGIAMFAQDATFQCSGSIISGNRCFDTQVSKTQEYGYSENANVLTFANDISVGVNKFSGNLTADVLLQSITTRNLNMEGTVTIHSGGFVGGVHTQMSALSIVNQGNPGFMMQFQSGGTHTGNRIFTVNLNDADRTLSLAQNVTFSGAFVTVGGSTIQLTSTGATALTLPTSGTLIAGPGSSTNKAAARFSGTGGTTLQDSAFNIADTNGEPSFTGTGWSTFSPTVTAASGTFASASGSIRYKQYGKMVYLIGTITITTVGAGAGTFPQFTLPVTPAGQAACGVAQNVTTGLMWTASAAGLSSPLALRRYDNSGTVASGDSFVVSLFYEAA